MYSSVCVFNLMGRCVYYHTVAVIGAGRNLSQKKRVSSMEVILIFGNREQQGECASSHIKLVTSSS